MIKDIEIKNDAEYFALKALSASQIKTYDKRMSVVWYDESHEIECKAKIDEIKRTKSGIIVIDYKTSSDIDSVIKWLENFNPYSAFSK